MFNKHISVNLSNIAHSGLMFSPLGDQALFDYTAKLGLFNLRPVHNATHIQTLNITCRNKSQRKEAGFPIIISLITYAPCNSMRYTHCASANKAPKGIPQHVYVCEYDNRPTSQPFATCPRILSLLWCRCPSVSVSTASSVVLSFSSSSSPPPLLQPTLL